MTTVADLTQPSQTPNPKLLVATIAGVVALHIGVGIGLINMPTLVIKPPKVTPPLEISFVPPPKPIEPEPVPKVAVQPEPKPEPKPEPALKPNVPKAKPVMQPAAKVDTVIQSTPKPTKTVENPNTTPQPTPEPVKEQPKPIVPPEPQLDQQAILTQQAQQAEQIAQQKAQAEQLENQRRAEIVRQQAENERLAREQAEKRQAEQQRLAQQQAEQQRAEQLAKAQADRERAEREQAEKQKAEQQRKEQERQQAAQNSEPVSFGNGDASWRSKPNLNFSGNLARIIEEEQLTSIGVRLNVSSSGSVTGVTITRSSGNSQIDNAVKQRLYSAKLKPFTRNGVAVAGVGNLTVNLN